MALYEDTTHEKITEAFNVLLQQKQQLTSIITHLVKEKAPQEFIRHALKENDIDESNLTVKAKIHLNSARLATEREMLKFNNNDRLDALKAEKENIQETHAKIKKLEEKYKAQAQEQEDLENTWQVIINKFSFRLIDDFEEISTGFASATAVLDQRGKKAEEDLMGEYVLIDHDFIEGF